MCIRDSLEQALERGAFGRQAAVQGARGQVEEAGGKAERGKATLFFQQHPAYPAAHGLLGGELGQFALEYLFGITKAGGVGGLQRLVDAGCLLYTSRCV